MQQTVVNFDPQMTFRDSLEYLKIDGQVGINFQSVVKNTFLLTLNS